MLYQIKPPQPIPFPNREELERVEAHRAAAHYAAQGRQLETLKAATASGHEQGYREGYLSGASVGMWTGLSVGCISTGVIGTAAYFIHAWAALQ